MDAKFAKRLLLLSLGALLLLPLAQFPAEAATQYHMKDFWPIAPNDHLLRFESEPDSPYPGAIEDYRHGTWPGYPDYFTVFHVFGGLWCPGDIQDLMHWEGNKLLYTNTMQSTYPTGSPAYYWSLGLPGSYAGDVWANEYMVAGTAYGGETYTWKQWNGQFQPASCTVTPVGNPTATHTNTVWRVVYDGLTGYSDYTGNITGVVEFRHSTLIDGQPNDWIMEQWYFYYNTAIGHWIPLRTRGTVCDPHAAPPYNCNGTTGKYIAWHAQLVNVLPWP